MRLAVLGGGIGACAFLYFLKSHPKSQKIDQITWIFNEKQIPACSFSSTAVAALRGIQRGFSPLGDELCEHWEVARKFYQDCNLPGVYFCKLFHLFSSVYSEIPQKFQHLRPVDSLPSMCQEECWSILPEIFLPHLHQHIRREWKQLTSVNDLVINIKKETLIRLTLQKGQPLSCDFIFDARGAELNFFEPLLPLKKVMGAFYEFPCSLTWQGAFRKLFPAEQPVIFNFHESSGNQFSHLKTLKEAQFIYHPLSQKVWIGSTSLEGEGKWSQFHQQQLDQLYQFWNDHHFIQEMKIKLPNPTPAHIRFGVRAKMHARRPALIFTSPQHLVLNGLYKNGWIHAWALGKKAQNLLPIED